MQQAFHFFAFGLNHERAPVTVREAFVLGEARQQAFYRTCTMYNDAAFMLLATCNRTETYGFGTDANVRRLQARLAAEAGAPWPRAHAFELSGDEALRHVLEMPCGLRSQILGDAQIFAQTKRAYVLAAAEGAVSTHLHRLLQTAFRAARRVRNETTLFDGADSVAGAALAAALEHRGTLDDARVLVLGAGEMGRDVLRRLSTAPLAHLAVANRTPERAAEAAAHHGTDQIPWAERYDAAAEADIVIVATGATRCVLEAKKLPPRAQAAPALLVDLAMPRNVEPAAGRRPGYALIDLDALRQAHTAEAGRRAALAPARAICDEERQNFARWHAQHRALQPALDVLPDTFEAIREQEVERHAEHLGTGERDELDRLTRSIVQKVLALPMARLREPDAPVDAADGARLLAHLFARPGCDDAPDTHPTTAIAAPARMREEQYAKAARQAA